MRINPPVLLQFSLSSFASVAARYLDNTPTFQGSATTHCLDSHPKWQTRGMSDKESATYGDGSHMEVPRLGTPQTLPANGANRTPMYTEDEVPERFVIGCSGDMQEATRRLVPLEEYRCWEANCYKQPWVRRANVFSNSQGQDIEQDIYTRFVFLQLLLNTRAMSWQKTNRHYPPHTLKCFIMFIKGYGRSRALIS